MGFSHSLTTQEVWFINKVHIVERTGWSLEYIDSLPFETIAAMTSVWAGDAKAQSKG